MKRGFSFFKKTNRGAFTLIIVNKARHNGRNETGPESFDSIKKINVYSGKRNTSEKSIWTKNTKPNLNTMNFKPWGNSTMGAKKWKL